MTCKPRPIMSTRPDLYTSAKIRHPNAKSPVPGKRTEAQNGHTVCLRPSSSWRAEPRWVPSLILSTPSQDTLCLSPTRQIQARASLFPNQICSVECCSYRGPRHKPPLIPPALQGSLCTARLCVTLTEPWVEAERGSSDCPHQQPPSPIRPSSSPVCRPPSKLLVFSESNPWQHEAHLSPKSQGQMAQPGGLCCKGHGVHVAVLMIIQPGRPQRLGVWDTVPFGLGFSP